MTVTTGMDPEDKEYESLKPIIEKNPYRALTLFSLQKQWTSQTIWAFILAGGLLLAWLLWSLAPEALLFPAIIIGCGAVISSLVAQVVIYRRTLRRQLLWIRISKELGMTEDGKNVPYTSAGVDQLIRATLDAERKQRIAEGR